MPSLIKPNAIAMNRILFCLATLVFCLKIPATAQTATAPRSDHPATTTFSRWSLSLETGPAFPVGAFHSIAQISPMAGYARTGYGAELSGNYRICHALGITLAAGLQQNPTATTLLYSEFPGAQGRPAAVHEDLMVIHPGEDGAMKAVYFDSEGHVIRYTIEAKDQGTLVFVSDPSPSAPRFRLSYAKGQGDEVSIKFEMAPPGKPDGFRTYLEGKARRADGPAKEGIRR